LEKRLESVFLQREYIDRIIILDDASSDGSLKIIEKYSNQNVEIIVNTINSGSVFKQWEKGLALIEKDALVWIAESDDISHAIFLNEILKPFKDPEVVLAYSRSFDIDEHGITLGLSYQNLDWANYSFVKEGKEEVVDHLYKQCTIPNVSAVVFRNNFVDTSFFSHNLVLCGDWYFYLRLLEKGKIAYVSEPLNYHRFHKKTVRSLNLKSLDILKERLLVVNETRNLYGLSWHQYMNSMLFQIDIYINETKISDLKILLLKKMFSIIKIYGYIFLGLTITIIFKRIIKRIYLFKKINLNIS
jgi:GT2 family glycosyltransferase